MSEVKEARLSDEEGIAVLKVRIERLKERVKRREEQLALKAEVEKERLAMATDIARLQHETDIMKFNDSRYFCLSPESHLHKLKHLFGFSDLDTRFGREWERDLNIMSKPPTSKEKKEST